MMHTHGIPCEKIEAVPQWRSSNVFEPLERLAMESAEVVSDTPPTVGDQLVSGLRSHLNGAQFVELTAIICLETLRSRRNSAGFKARRDFAQPSERANSAHQAGVQPEHRRAP